MSPASVPLIMKACIACIAKHFMLATTLATAILSLLAIAIPHAPLT